MSTEDQFKRLLEDALKESGRSLKGGVDATAKYMAELAAELSKAAGQPGFDYALRAARDAAAGRAGLNTAAQASAFDMRLIGLIQGMLGIAAGALASPA